MYIKHFTCFQAHRLVFFFLIIAFSLPLKKASRNIHNWVDKRINPGSLTLNSRVSYKNLLKRSTKDIQCSESSNNAEIWLLPTVVLSKPESVYKNQKFSHTQRLSSLIQIHFYCVQLSPFILNALSIDIFILFLYLNVL